MGMSEPIWQQWPPCVLQTSTRPYLPFPETHSIGSEGLHRYQSVFIFLKESLLNINDCVTSMFNASVFSQQASGAIHSTEEREKGELLFFLNITAFYRVLGGFIRCCTLGVEDYTKINLWSMIKHWSVKLVLISCRILVLLESFLWFCEPAWRKIPIRKPLT